MAQGESSNEYVSNRASWQIVSPALLNIKRPRSAGARGISRRPTLLVVHTQLEKEFLQLGDLPGECRGQLHKRYRRDHEPVGKFDFQKLLGIGGKLRVVETDIQQEAGVNDPRHVPLPEAIPSTRQWSQGGPFGIVS